VLVLIEFQIIYQLYEVIKYFLEFLLNQIKHTAHISFVLSFINPNQCHSPATFVENNPKLLAFKVTHSYIRSMD